jgi:hypothetical protein
MSHNHPFQSRTYPPVLVVVLVAVQNAAKLTVMAYDADGRAINEKVIELVAMRPTYVDTADQAEFQQAASFTFVVQFDTAACEADDIPVLVMDVVDVRPSQVVTAPSADSGVGANKTDVNQTAGNETSASGTRH